MNSVPQTVYPYKKAGSRRKLLDQAAEVLCLLSLFPLGETARAGYLALFERRIERAYAGGQR